MQIKIETLNSKILEFTQEKVFIRLKNGDEPVTVTCSKINCFQDGVIKSSLNSIDLESDSCFTYQSVQNEPNCLVKKFKATLQADNNVDVFSFECLNEDKVLTNFEIIRLCKF